MQPDIELETWRGQWQSQETVPPDLQRRVEREIRLARVSVLVAVIVTFAFGIGVPAWAVTSRRTDVMVLAIGVWVFIVVSWIVSLRLGGAAGARPVAATTAAFLQFSIVGCERRRQAIAAAAALYVTMLAFVLAWKYHESIQHAPIDLWTFLTSPPILNVWGITLALALSAAWWRHRLGGNLRTLRELRHQLETPDSR